MSHVTYVSPDEVFMNPKRDKKFSVQNPDLNSEEPSGAAPEQIPEKQVGDEIEKLKQDSF